MTSHQPDPTRPVSRVAKGVPTGGQFATSARSEASAIDLFAEMGMVIDPDAVAAAEAQMAAHNEGRRIQGQARDAVAVGDHVYSAAGTWEVTRFGHGTEIHTRLIEQRAAVKVGTLGKTNLHNPDLRFDALDPETGTVLAATEDVGPVPVLTDNSGLSTAHEGIFGGEAVISEHIQRRTWATGNPDAPYVTITVTHAATAVRQGADIDERPLDSADHDYEVSRDPSSVRYRSEKHVEAAHHHNPNEPWAASDLPTRTHTEVVMAFDDATDAARADAAAARHARMVDWREYHHLLPSLPRPENLR